jgi:predicted signal transduction protein with EAL and GGDEF domain
MRKLGPVAIGTSRGITPAEAIHIGVPSSTRIFHRADETLDLIRQTTRREVISIFASDEEKQVAVRALWEFWDTPPPMEPLTHEQAMRLLLGNELCDLAFS